MQRFRGAAAAVLMLTWLASCDTPAPATAPELTPSMSASEQGLESSADHRHSFELRDSQGAKNSAKPGGGGGTGISYHGGTVLQGGINVVAVYWANGAIYTNGPTPGTSSSAGNSGDASLVGTFLRTIGGSSYYNINHTYTNASNAALVNAVTYTGFWANNANVPANGQNVSDANMIAMLQSGFNSGALRYDANTLYAIFTAGTVNLGGGAGTQYCAYHTNGTVTVGGVARRIYYAAMPYNHAWPSGCTSGLATPNTDAAADAEVNTLIHEIEETQTDALGNAWYDTRGYENADKCAWLWGTTFTTATGGKYNITTSTGGKYLVQMNWVNSGSGGCKNGW